MERQQFTFRVTYNFTTSHQPEGSIDSVCVWALNLDNARDVFYQLFNNRFPDGSRSSTNYEILEVIATEPEEDEKIYGWENGRR